MRYLNYANRNNENIPEFLWTLLDFSGSMYEDDYKPSRIEGAIKANTKLIKTKAGLYPQDQMGIIAFDDKAHVLHTPAAIGKGSKSLCNSLRKDIEENGGTNFTAALELAEKCLFTSTIIKKPSGIFSRLFSEILFESPEHDLGHIRKINTQDKITRRIVMLTDGEHNGDGFPVKVAKRLKDAGVIIECIGIAGKRKDVDEIMLKKIASIDDNGKPRYCFIKDSSDLIKKYESMAHHIRPA